MRLDPDALMFGVAPKILKDCANQLRSLDLFSLDDFCRALGAPQDEAKPVLAELVKNSFLSKRRSSDGTVFIPTTRLNQLALASISKGLPRDKATVMLSRVVEQAKHINANPDEFGYRINRLAVFGSFLGAAPLLGDLDIAADYTSIPGVMKKLQEEKRLTIFERLTNDSYRSKTLSCLRSPGRRQISLHEWDELEDLKTPFKVVLE